MYLSYPNLSLLLVVALFGLSSTSVNGKLKGGGGQQEQEQEQRSLEVLIETKPCVSFDSPAVKGAIQSGPSNPWGLYSEECDTNDCNDGCCRAYTHVLNCDKKNDFPQLPCVCNANTATPAPITPAPTPEPTPSPTEDDRMGGGGNGIPLCATEYGAFCDTGADCCSSRCFRNECQKSVPKGKKFSVSAVFDDRSGLRRVRGGAGGLFKNGFSNGGGRRLQRRADNSEKGKSRVRGS